MELGDEYHKNLISNIQAIKKWIGLTNDMSISLFQICESLK